MSHRQPEPRARIESRREARTYDEYLRGKIDIARAQREIGSRVSNEEVIAEAVARRTALLRRVGGACR